ncbi:hypothetical protein Q8A73_015867 [Channa argus]|nr:hypothetical protein Q8A73_015867 [Channa argus]
MSEESICLYDLLNLAIGKPQRGVVNFNALHALLLAVLRQLDIREIKTEWKESPGDRHLAYLVDVTEAKQPEHTDEKQKADVEPKAEPVTELQESRPSSSSQTPSADIAGEEQWRVISRVQACEDGVSKAMKLIQELQTSTPKDSLTDEIKDHQQKLVGEQEKMVTSMKKCFHRVDALEETVKSLKDTLQKYPEPHTELHEPRPSPSSQTPSTATAKDEQGRFFSRVQACEDGLSKAMKLIQELLTLTHKDSLKDEIKDHQQKFVGEQEEMVTSVEKCFHRVDALEEIVKSLKDTFQKYPEPDTELHEPRPSPSSQTPSTATASDEQWRFFSRVQACEDGLSKAMNLIQELLTLTHKDSLKDEIKDHQQKLVGEQEDMVSSVEKCLHRVDALEETVKSLKDTFQKYPEPDNELHEPRPSPSSQTPSTATASDEQWRLFSRVQACEDGLSKAMKLIQELLTLTHKDSLKDEIKDHQQKLVGEQEKMVTSMKKCFHRVDALEETVKSLKDTFQKYPGPEELSQYVTWDIMQSVLVSKTESLQKVTSTESSTLQEAMDTKPGTEPSSAMSPQQTPLKSDVTGAAMPPSRESGSSVETLRNIGKIKESVNKLDARLAAVEEGKVDQPQLTHLRELITKTVSQDVSNKLMGQLNQQRALIDNLKSDSEKLYNLLDVFINPTSPERESTSEGASEDRDSDSRQFHELEQQKLHHRKSLQKLKEDVKQHKAIQASSEKGMTDQHLQDQLDDLRGMLEDMMLSLTSELSSSFKDDDEQDESDSQGLGENNERSSFITRTVNIGRKLSSLFQSYELLQDTVNNLLQQQTGGSAEAAKKGENAELVNNVQEAILQLQAECEKLHETTRCLHEDNRQKQTHIEELYKTMEELEEKKADKQMVESEIKADKSALETKVSRLQFDSATEQLNTMFHELLNKVIGQEQDWHKVIDKLSTEMECKLNRIELDSLKKQLEDRWKNIHKNLQAQGAPEHEDAAGLRKKLMERFNCLSCDRPVMKHTPGPHLVTLPSSPGFPSHKSIRPFTVYALEQFRQHYRSLRPGTNRNHFEAANSGRIREHLQKSHAVIYRQPESMQKPLKHCEKTGSQGITKEKLKQNQPGVQHERIAELTDYSHLVVSRSCGGSHTIASPSQRRTGLQFIKHHSQPEVDGIVQSEEVDILGLDGHIYKGRLNPPPIRSTETKLPTISTKDGLCKTKDKSRSSPSHKPPASPEMGHNALVHQSHSAKSAQLSRSVSSISGQDWPVSALGCASQGSISSVAAESNSEPLDK